MARTKLYAVERLIPAGKEYEHRFMVYGGVDNPQGVTWTKNIAKASRWQNRHDAVTYRDEVVKAYKIKDATLITEV